MSNMSSHLFFGGLLIQTQVIHTHTAKNMKQIINRRIKDCHFR